MVVVKKVAVRLADNSIRGSTIRNACRNILPPVSPDKVKIWGERKEGLETWEKYIDTESDVEVIWEGEERSALIFEKEDSSIFLYNRSRSVSFAELLYFLSHCPFLTATFPSFHIEWMKMRGRPQLRLDSSPTKIGWGFALRGEAHQRFVSRRWIERGPWYVEYLPNDTTLVVLHDLEAEAQPAYEQATLGYTWMASPDGSGGFLKRPYHRCNKAEFKAFYNEATKTLEVPVLGREVTKAEMLDLCAMRMTPIQEHEFGALRRFGMELPDHTLGKGLPVEQLAYIFALREEAEKYLHDLWMRDIQCWYLDDDAEKVRLDLDYEPPPVEKPAWVADFARRVAEDKAEA